MKSIMIIISIFIGIQASAQSDKPFIKLVEPTKAETSTKTSRQFIVGSTCSTCKLDINGTAVKVYPTGAFAYELNLKPGDTAFNLVASSAAGTTVSKKLSYNYSLPAPPDTVKTLDIASIETFPEGNLFVMPGDRIKFKVKALPGATVVVNGNIPLYEMKMNKMPGIYQGEYVVKETDNFLVSQLP
ncbi:MAG TPA: hypothetical protein VHL77_10005, partial [Ferruginibacter sp.]|nr:hypothetical protein [Ferruginibacter sp.]